VILELLEGGLARRSRRFTLAVAAEKRNAGEAGGELFLVKRHCFTLHQRLFIRNLLLLNNVLGRKFLESQPFPRFLHPLSSLIEVFLRKIRLDPIEVVFVDSLSNVAHVVHITVKFTAYPRQVDREVEGVCQLVLLLFGLLLCFILLVSDQVDLLLDYILVSDSTQFELVQKLLSLFVFFDSFSLSLSHCCQVLRPLPLHWILLR